MSCRASPARGSFPALAWGARLAMASALALLPSRALAQADEPTVKAVFLDRFARFVEWPASAGVSDTASPFVISVLGDDAFADVVESIYRERTIRDKRVAVRRVSEPVEAAGSHILFVGRSEDGRLDRILAQTRDEAILTVADSEGFALRGVHINFFLRAGRIGFEVNEPSLRRSFPEVSYLLLRAAELVGAGP